MLATYSYPEPEIYELLSWDLPGLKSRRTTIASTSARCAVAAATFVSPYGHSHHRHHRYTEKDTPC
jgi:hypothetical protein